MFKKMFQQTRISNIHRKRQVVHGTSARKHGARTSRAGEKAGAVATRYEHGKGTVLFPRLRSVIGQATCQNSTIS